ncbi:MAG: pilin [Sedimenticola sp.]
MKKVQAGFTLIELMIVVAIIGILAAIAIPAYQDYMIRTKVSEAFTLASGSKTAVAEYYNTMNAYPASNTAAGLAPAASISGEYTDTVTVGTGGTITAALNSTAGTTGNIQLVPAYQGGSFEWTCNGTGTTVNDQYLPANCR